MYTWALNLNVLRTGTRVRGLYCLVPCSHSDHIIINNSNLYEDGWGNESLGYIFTASIHRKCKHAFHGLCRWRIPKRSPGSPSSDIGGMKKKGIAMLIYVMLNFSIPMNIWVTPLDWSLLHLRTGMQGSAPHISHLYLTSVQLRFALKLDSSCGKLQFGGLGSGG